MTMCKILQVRYNLRALQQIQCDMLLTTELRVSCSRAFTESTAVVKGVGKALLFLVDPTVWTEPFLSNLLQRSFPYFV